MGDLLLGDQAAKLSYTASGSLNENTTYPGAISGITLNGQDITSSITNGKLGGLIQLRDDTLPGEQDKLNQLASTLIDQVNTVSNAGSAFPPPNSLTSAGTVSASDAFPAAARCGSPSPRPPARSSRPPTWTCRPYATVGQLIAGINAIGGVTAAISSDGKLSITANSATNGVAINGMTSSVGASGQPFSSYFGFNNVFSGTDAASIALAPNLTANALALPTATLSAAAGLAAGQNGVSSSDIGAINALGSALTSSTAFAATGSAAAQNNTLSAYASNFVSKAATMISNANAAASSSQSNLNYVQNALANETGINVDQQTELATQYQNQYQAAAS